MCPGVQRAWQNQAHYEEILALCKNGSPQTLGDLPPSMSMPGNFQVPAWFFSCSGTMKRDYPLSASVSPSVKWE